MSIFYNIGMFRKENFRHMLVLFSLFISSFIALILVINVGIPSQDLNAVWQTIRIAPIVFGTLTYVVLGVSLSFLSYRSLAKIICFTAVITDIKNKRLVNAFLFNLLLLNIFASSLILGYIGLYFVDPPAMVAHIVYLLLVALIIPITYCMRILEGCIDKIVNLELDVENNCLRFIKLPHN